MSKALKVAAVVVGVVAIAVTGGAALGLLPAAGFLGLGISTAALGTLLTVTSAVLGLAAGVMAKKPKLGSTGSQLDFIADPAAGEPYVVGQAMVGMNIVHQASWGAKNKFLGLVGVISCAGPIMAYDGLYADMTHISFSGANATGYYANFMYLSTQLGANPEAAALSMTAPDATVMPDWGTDYKTSGLATAGLVLVADVDDGKIYSGGMPKMTHLVRGVLAYDARYDDTNGGTGTQRALDESTYVYTNNPWAHAATYALGRWRNGVRVIGPGLSPSQIDWAAFKEAAQIAAVNLWRVSGMVYSTDRKWDVLKAMAQAGGGYPMPSGAHLSCLINSPKVSVETITEADVKGAVSAPQMQTRRSRINGAIPRYRSADHGWEIVPADAVRNADYLVADGGVEATREIEFALVCDPGSGDGLKQAAQLAAYEVANSRERGPISVELSYYWSQYKLGDCLTLDLPSANLIDQKAIVIGRTVNVARNTVTLEFRTEDDAKHTWALSQTGAVSTAPTVIQPPGTGDSGSSLDLTAILTNSYPISLRALGVDAGSNATITLDGGSTGVAFAIDYGTSPRQNVVVPAGAVTGLAYETSYWLYADVDAALDATPTYGATTIYGTALNSAAHPKRIYLNRVLLTPAAGGADTTPSGGGGGYGSGSDPPDGGVGGTSFP